MSDPITPLTPEQTAKAEAKSAKHGYVVRNLISVDQLGETLVDGPNDTTISGESAIAAQNDKGLKGWVGRSMSRFLNLFQKDHGAKAVAGDLERAQTAGKIDEESGVINQ